MWISYGKLTKLNFSSKMPILLQCWQCLLQVLPGEMQYPGEAVIFSYKQG